MKNTSFSMRFFLVLLFQLFLIIPTATGNGIPLPPPDPGATQNNETGGGAPIGGGLGILAGLSLAYAFRKSYRKQKEQHDLGVS